MSFSGLSDKTKHNHSSWVKAYLPYIYDFIIDFIINVYLRFYLELYHRFYHHCL